jgi:hypothetical protein
MLGMPGVKKRICKINYVQQYQNLTTQEADHQLQSPIVPAGHQATCANKLLH